MIILRTFSKNKEKGEEYDPIKHAGKISTGIIGAGAALGAIGNGINHRVYVNPKGKFTKDVSKIAEDAIKKRGDKGALEYISKMRGRSLAGNMGHGALEVAGRWAIPAVAIGAGVAAYKSHKNKKQK